MSSQFTEADAIRILVATDNHVGYEERDPIRKNDSWRTFDEVINLARKEDVDMVLLAGDLFHDNKPSRQAMFQVMRTLRKNCLGMKPCELQFMSDGNEVFAGAFSHVNYEDPDINVSIPVFSIHGNHDDPTGDGFLCSLDLLQVAGLVNYFGRIQEVDNIQAKPILLQKGQTKLALYGLSNVRDERMHRSFRDNQVKWFRPNVQSSDWFNLLAVHQNHHAHTPTSYLPEGFLPEWLNLVVWGHEHECLIDPTHNPETGFHVMQPGSSVATSLVPSEAVAKHVAIVTVTGKDFKVEKRRLKTVRPFVTREICLAKDDRFRGLEKKKDNQQELSRKLTAIVEEMIVEANKDWESMHDGDITEQERPLPLIRLKVDFTPSEGGHYECENPQRFSNRFLGKVANTNDVVYFTRKKPSSRKNNQIEDIPNEVLQAMGLDSIEVERLVNEYLESQTLKILPQAPFGDAVTQFVAKQDRHAMEDFVKDSLSSQMKQMMALGKDEDEDEDEDLDSVMEQCKKKLEDQFKAGLLKQSRRIYKPKPDNWDSDMEGHWLDQEGAVEYEAKAAGPPQATRSMSLGSTPIASDEDEEMEDAEPEEVVPKKRGRPKAATAKPAAAKKAPAKKAPAKKEPAKKASAKGRGRKAGPFLEDSDEEDDVFIDDDDDVVEEAAVPPKRAAATRSQPSRSQPSRGAPMKQTKLNFSQNGSQNQPLEVSDDMISDDDDDPFESMPAKKTGRRR